jgi:3-hydroxybutyrate dehydrogenase
MRLKDKVAIITGAARGIGKEIAIVFAREGAKVAIADLDGKAADATARELDATGTRAIGVAMDVADEQQVDAGTAKVISTFGALDILVSNAGIQICWLSISTARSWPHVPRFARCTSRTVAA